MKATKLTSLIGVIGCLAQAVQASVPTTAGLAFGGKTTVAVCFPGCVDSSATDPLSYTLNGGAASIISPITLLGDSHTVFMDVSGVTGGTYKLTIASGQIQTCTG